MDGSAFFVWALSCCEPRPRLTFLGWDDTRRLVCPGEPDRTNDLVAIFRDEDSPKRQVWMVSEVEEEAEKGALYRMGQYEVLLAKEVNPACDPDGPAVGSLLINLTGEQHVNWCQVNWLRATEGWMMRESQYIKSWERVGEQRAELRTQRANLLKAVKLRLEDPVPEPIRLAIEGTNDLSKLETWYDAALTVDTIAELRKEMKLET
jgi:hypothetical protein